MFAECFQPNVLSRSNLLSSRAARDTLDADFLQYKYFYQLDKIIILIALLENVRTMSTTIPIDKPTKARLFFLKNRIEQQEGRPINYSELLQILIKNMEFSQAPKHLNEFRKFLVILSPDAMETFRKERELDLHAEERKGQIGRKSLGAHKQGET